MDINVLNKNLERIAIVDTYTSLMWCKRFNETGALDLQIEATTENVSLFKDGYYITRNDDDAIFRINNIELNTASNKDNSLLIGGVDCKAILGQRIIWGQENYEGTVENYLRKLINDNVINPTDILRKIDNFALKNAHGFTETISQQATYTELDKKISDVCKSKDFGWKVSFENNNFYFDLFKGVDRSVNQNVNPHLIFSPNYDNLISSKYKFNSSDFKNVALVGGEGEGNERKTQSVGTTTGLDRYEMFVDAKGISTKSNTPITEQEYNAMLQNKGVEELAKNEVTQSFEGEVVTDYYKYKNDYDLGDIVTLQNEYGIQINAKISEVIETWDISGYNIEPKFEF